MRSIKVNSVCAVPSFHARVVLRVVSILEIHVNNVYVKDSYFRDDLIEDEVPVRPWGDLVVDRAVHRGRWPVRGPKRCARMYRTMGAWADFNV